MEITIPPKNWKSEPSVFKILADINSAIVMAWAKTDYRECPDTVHLSAEDLKELKSREIPGAAPHTLYGFVTTYETAFQYVGANNIVAAVGRHLTIDCEAV